MSNRVIKKIVYLLEAKLASPLCVSNGDDLLTDKDVIKDASGRPFIPGSSLAGAMRGYLGKAADKNCIFGYEKMNAVGRMSAVYISDFQFVGKEISLRVRDGVALSEQKTAISGAKYDMEVVDTGAEGYFYIEMVIRSEDDEKHMLQQIQKVLGGWKQEDIRLGAKKTRGYGELKLMSVRVKTYDQTNILEYANVYNYADRDNVFKEKSILESIEVQTLDSKYVSIKVPLKQNGGISIRQYAAEKGKPDFTHITANGLPVIPGTSFSGALRHRIKDILEQMGVTNCKQILERMFGYVNAVGSVDKAHRSLIIVNECVLQNAVPLTMIRNGISRFESGAKSGALFKETTYVGGKTTLEIKVENQKDRPEETEAIIGFLMLALKDLSLGYLAVGGQTSVGRGCFQKDGEISVSGIDYSEERCLKNAFMQLELKGD